jgi:FkbM family methyltransferase
MGAKTHLYTSGKIAILFSDFSCNLGRIIPKYYMIKQQIKNLLSALKLDLTQNLKYDRLTKIILQKNLKQDSNCIDIGCHKGEVMDDIVSHAPKGNHFGFEPIPDLNGVLFEKYADQQNITISSVALSNENGEAEFNYVKNAPAYSGLKKRKYATKNPDIQKIKVKTQTLDSYFEEMGINQKIDLVKIDVEGAEMMVLQGAKNTLAKNKPLIIFEFGLGASDFYNTTPEDMFAFIQKDLHMNISTLEDFVHQKNSLSKELFNNLYSNNKEYYFIIHP